MLNINSKSDENLTTFVPRNFYCMSLQLFVFEMLNNNVEHTLWSHRNITRSANFCVCIFFVHLDKSQERKFHGIYAKSFQLQCIKTLNS